MFAQRQTNIGNVAQVFWAMLYVVTRTPDDDTGGGGQSYPTLKTLLPYLGVQSAHQRNLSYSTFTDKVICGLRGKLSHNGEALRYHESCFVWHETGHRESRRAPNLL